MANRIISLLSSNLGGSGNKVYVVTSEAEMLALPAKVGDIAIRTDVSSSFILGQEPPTFLANWYAMGSSINYWDKIDNIVYPAPGLGIDTILLQDASETYILEILHDGANALYNTTAGIHWFQQPVRGDEFHSDGKIFLGDVGTPSNPVGGGLIYYKADGNLYTLNPAGSETNLTVGASDSKWQQATSALFPKDSLGIDTLTLKNVAQTQFWLVNKTDTDVDYNNSSGIHNFLQAVKTTSLDVGHMTTMSASNGINLYDGNTDWRIGFDNQGATVSWMRFNIDTAAATHNFTFTAGPVGTPNIVARISGAGKLSVGSQAPEASVDAFDFRLGETAVPSAPTDGYILYATATSLFAKDSSNNVTDLIAAASDSKWNVDGTALVPKDSPSIDQIKIIDLTKTQNIIIKKLTTGTQYNTSNGNHIFNSNIDAIGKYVNVGSSGVMTTAKGINFYDGNDQYRASFDNNVGGLAAMRFNIDANLNTHCIAFTAGVIGGANDILVRMRGDGLMAVGSHSPESKLDVDGDIRVAEITTPATPTSGGKIYYKADGDLYTVNSSGVESNLTSGVTDSKWDASVVGALFPKDALAVDRIFIKDTGMTQAFTLQNLGTYVSYTNSSGGGHRFLGGNVSIGSQAPESNLDLTSDLRLGEITTPANPTSGGKLYYKADGNLYTLNSSGTESNLTAGASDSKWDTSGNSIFPKQALSINTISLMDLAVTQSLNISHSGTFVTYTNTFSGGAHSFLGGPVQSSWIKLTNQTPAAANTGISLYELNDNYKISFDNTVAAGAILYNIDVAADTHAHAWGFGTVGSTTIRMRLYGDGDLAVGAQTPESRIDVSGDIRISPIAAPASPTTGWKIYGDSTSGHITAISSGSASVGLTKRNQVTTSSATYNATASDDIVVVDASANSVDVVVDATILQRPLTIIVKVTGGGFNATVSCPGGQFINDVNGGGFIIALNGDTNKGATIWPMSSSTNMYYSTTQL